MKHTISSGACLYWADSTVKILRKYGYNAQLQAGSLQWSCRNNNWIDDGVSHTHFSYMWDKNVARQFLRNGLLSVGILPEMHCWAGIIDTNEIVDLSTRHLIQQYEKTMREEWQAPTPPLYLWADKDTILDGVRYIPDVEAIYFALMVLKETKHVDSLSK